MVYAKKLALTIVICMFCLYQVGCRQQEKTTDTDIIENTQTTQIPKANSLAVQGGSIKISMRNPQTLNPIINMDETVDQTLKLIFEPLVDFNEHDEVVPNIAESWTMDEKGTTLDIQLKSNIQWHDGTPLTADDVVFSLAEIQKAAQSPYKRCVRNMLSYKAIDQHTVRILYKEPFSGYEYTLYFPIIPSHVADINVTPVGNGAYIYESLTPMKQMKLTYNPHYFRGAPYIAEIQVMITPDPESDLYSFDQGLIDVIGTDVIDWEKYSKNKKSHIYEYITMYYDFIGINFNKPMFQSAKTRQALLYAIDRSYLLEKYYLNHGEIVDVPVSPLSWLYEPQSKRYEFDVKKAKELLETPLQFQLLVNQGNVQRKNVALAIQKMYKDIGIQMEIVEVDEATFIERLQNKQYDLFLGGWELSVIPDLSFALHSSGAIGGSNYGGYVNSDMDQLLKEAFIAPNNKQLKQAYSKLQMHITEQLPYISLYFRSAALLTNEKIKGEIRPHHMNIYHNIYQWYVNAKNQ